MKTIDSIALIAITISLIISIHDSDSISDSLGWLCALIWCTRTFMSEYKKKK